MFHHCYNIQVYKNIYSLLSLPQYSWTLDLYTGLEIWCYSRIHPHLFLNCNETNNYNLIVVCLFSLFAKQLYVMKGG